MSVAGVAHLVERHLAKVEVASSSLVARSIEQIRRYLLFFCAFSQARTGHCEPVIAVTGVAPFGDSLRSQSVLQGLPPWEG